MNKYQRFISSLLLKAVQGVALSALILAGAPLFAQDASVKNVGVYYDDGETGNDYSDPVKGKEYQNGQGIYCNWSNVTSTELVDSLPSNRSFVFKPAPSGNQNQNDPWVSSALIEYDQPYPGVGADPSDPTNPNANKYPNHCLALCMDVYCNNAPVGQTTYSIAFPLQNITFDIVKYFNNKNLKNADDAPPVRSIDIYPGIDTADLAAKTNALAEAKEELNEAKVALVAPKATFDAAVDAYNTAKEAVTNSASTGVCDALSGLGWNCGSSYAYCYSYGSCQKYSLANVSTKQTQHDAWVSGGYQCVDTDYDTAKTAYETAVTTATTACNNLKAAVPWECNEADPYPTKCTLKVLQAPTDVATVEAGYNTWSTGTKKCVSSAAASAQEVYDNAITAATTACGTLAQFGGWGCQNIVDSTGVCASGTYAAPTDLTALRTASASWTSADKKCYTGDYATAKPDYDAKVATAQTACTNLHTAFSDWSCVHDTAQPYCDAGVYNAPADLADLTTKSTAWTTGGSSCLDSTSTSITPTDYAGCSSCADAADIGNCQAYYKVTYYNTNTLTAVNDNAAACTTLQNTYQSPTQYSECESICANAGTQRTDCQAYYKVDWYDNKYPTETGNAWDTLFTNTSSACTALQAAGTSFEPHGYADCSECSADTDKTNCQSFYKYANFLTVGAATATIGASSVSTACDNLVAKYKSLSDDTYANCAADCATDSDTGKALLTNCQSYYQIEHYTANQTTIDTALADTQTTCTDLASPSSKCEDYKAAKDAVATAQTNYDDVKKKMEVSSNVKPENYMCGSYHCSNAGKTCDPTIWCSTLMSNCCKNGDVGECLGAHWMCDSSYCWPSTSSKEASCRLKGDSKKWASETITYVYDNQTLTRYTDAVSDQCYKNTPIGTGSNHGTIEYKACQIEGASASEYHGCCAEAGHSDCFIFDNNGAESNTALRFCTAWDGSYEIDGEFGKRNGDYGYRATVSTKVPGDSVAVDSIEFESTIVYPGMNQIPIQVDVTNVHTVRSTPTTVGDITAVAAQPYTFVYKLSKDADVRIAVFDASDDAEIEYGENNTQEFAGNNSPETEQRIVRELVDWKPRHGEGLRGKESEVEIQESESWDGRNNDGLLLPAGNYLVAIQAKSQDEWPGIDFSRAVTRQVSLDPLKLTDVQVRGLTKQSTAYATISYVPTEASKVYWEIYTPGTNFAGADSYNNAYTLTDSSSATGTSPNAQGGSLVYRGVEDKSGRVNYTAKWDGLCHAYNADGTEKPDGFCTVTYAKGDKLPNGQKCQDDSCPEQIQNGAPMPDGNYVYVLWAEIPYNGCYYNVLGNGGTGKPAKFVPGGVCDTDADYTYNGRQFTGVKTVKYLIGQLPVERGLVGITMQPVSYSTVGSSPTAYGLDPFIFKYALDREADVVATIENTAGVVVKYLTPETGITQVAQQLNTFSWDGLDDQGRFVTPGTYMFKVRANDAMFPAQSNQAITIFPVDLLRVVDVTTTDVYGDSDARATISYLLSKAMNVQVNIYNKDVIIPHYNSTTGDYESYKVDASYNGELAAPQTSLAAGAVAITLNDAGATVVTNADALPTSGSVITYPAANTRDTWTIYQTGKDDMDNPLYNVTLVREEITATESTDTTWPPRLCNTDDDADVMTSGYIDPAKVSAAKRACIYVNDTAFTNYPSKAQAAAGVVDVRLQPVKTFDRSALKAGDGIQIMEEWDALYFYNPNDTKCAGATDKTQCTYETVPDGQYPFYISARSDAGFNRYYANTGEKDADNKDYLQNAPFKTHGEIKQEASWYATEKPIGKINVTRGPVYFLEGSVAVYPNAPQVFNASTGPTFIPPYEINFAVSRASTVEVAIVSLKDNVCSPVTPAVKDPKVNVSDVRNNKAGDICKFISTMTIANTGNFDASQIRKAYWDGTDHNGNYVKPGIYEVRLTARNYPNPSQYQATVKTIAVNADLLKVFDLLEADGYSIAQRNTNMTIGYQISVPMKVAIQIFKPGTTIYDYSKGTLRNPTTGNEVKDIHEVLVRAIVGIRPATTLINELWDGRDYAQQEVPDGTYPFRFVTALTSSDIDSMTGEIIGDWAQTDGQDADKTLWKINKVADTYEYQNLHRATVAIGDGRFVCSDWEKTVFFYPNPLVDASKGTLEITKMPVPGVVSIKFFNLAGDLVREGDYTCVDANNYQVQMGRELAFQPDNIVSSTPVAVDPATGDLTITNIRNAALRCKWDRTNQHGRKVARGVYFGLVDFKAQNGREHCQKVVKVLVP